MRITTALFKRIEEILEQCPNLELVYIKADKDDRVDITFMATEFTESQAIYLKTRLHSYQTRFISMEWPATGAVKIEMIDVVI